MKIDTITTWFLLVVMAFLPETARAGKVISYSGSSTIGIGILEAGAVKAYEEKNGNKFALIEMPGSGKGIKALLDGSR